MKLIDYLKEEGTTVDKCSVITIDLFNKPRYRMFDYPTNEAVHSFAITKVSGEEGNIYYEYDNDGCNDFSKDINLADVYLYGSVKWDGCSNWMYPEQTKNCMLHFCSVEEAQLVAKIMDWAYEIASQQISTFEG